MVADERRYVDILSVGRMNPKHLLDLSLNANRFDRPREGCRINHFGPTSPGARGAFCCPPGYPEDTFTLCQGTSWSDAKALAMVSASKRLGTVLVISSRVLFCSVMDMVTL